MRPQINARTEPEVRPLTATRAAVAVLVVLGSGLGVASHGRAQGPGSGLRLAETVEMTLAHDPNISLVRVRVELSRGALVSAASPFDPVLAADLVRAETEAPGTAAGDEVAISSSVGIFRRLRTGLSFEPSVDLVRTDDGPAAAENRGTVSFALRQPLLRGRGREVVTAAERSAARDLEASRLDYRHAVSSRLAAVISQYWIVAATALDLEVLRSTEESSRDLLETTRRLIAADVTPAAEIVQIEADLVAREASRIAGEQALFAALQALGREIGLRPDEIAALPLPSEPFPEIDPATVPAAEREGGHFTRAALARRADLRAAEERLDAARALLAAARNALRPQLDLSFVPSYSSEVLGDGTGDFLSPVFEDIPGLSTLVGLSLSWPLRSRQAEGDLIRTEAAVELADLERERIVKAIGADTPAALDAVHSSALQLERSERALRLFEETVENEEKKLQAGSSTLIDLISQRDRLTAARRRHVDAQLALALALVELRFQTGSLIAEAGGADAFRLQDVTTLPGFGPP